MASFYWAEELGKERKISANRFRAAAEQRDVGEITSSSPPKQFLFSESQISPTVDPTVTRIQCIKRDDEDDDIIRNMRIRKPKKKKKIMTDSELAKDLAREIGKANTVAEQRREAMKKSGEILWGEFCRHMELKEDEMKIKWSKIGEEEKVVLVREFVDEWAGDFQPLSVRSVKEMVEQECLDSSMESSASLSSFSGLFPGLKRIIGFE